MGVPSALGFNVLSWLQIIKGMDILTFFDFISNSIIMPIIIIILNYSKFFKFSIIIVMLFFYILTLLHDLSKYLILSAVRFGK